MQTTSKTNPQLGIVLVWDGCVRLGHWLLAASFATAWITSESESWRLVHTISGLIAMAIVLFRVVWGLIGSRHARFGSFVRRPGEALAYLRTLLSGRPAHFTGHNPAGGWAVLGLLGLVLLTAATGLANERELGGRLVEEAHELLATLSLGLVGLHVAAVAVSSLLHRENLVRAMFSGRKLGLPQEAIRPGQGWLAALALVLWVLGFVAWLR